MNVSKKPEKTSNVAHAHQANASVFDFLYHDPQRIGSFLAQFDPAGVLQSLKRTRAVSETRSSTSDDAVTLGVGIAKAEMKEVGVESEREQDATERMYDALWSNARTFLDYPQQGGLLQRDINAARIGQFALVSGELSVLDLGLMKGAWDLPIFRATAGADDVTTTTGNRQQRRAGSAPVSQPKTAQSHPVDFAFEMLGILPHTIQARLVGEDAATWCTLLPDCMSVTAADLMMKHGLQMPGRWNIVGIVDGLSVEAEPPAVEMLSEIAVHGAVPAMFAVIAPIARTIMGRPADFFAMTPLLIFREVTGA